MSTWFILAVLVCGAAAWLPRTKEDDFRAETPHGRAVSKASVIFLKEAASEYADQGGVVLSPLAIFILLSLYSAGTSGGLRDDIITALGATNYTELADTYTQLSKDFGELNSDFLSMDNKMYLAKGGKLTDAFTRASADYRAELENVDFTDPNKAAATINHWADEKTKGSTQNPLPVIAEGLSRDTVLSIFNIIYFKVKWEEPFDPNSTRDRIFHANPGNVLPLSMMSMKKRLFYAESEKLDAKMVELPLEKGFRMVILLPNDKEGLPSMLDKMAEGDAFYDALQSMQRSSADVYILLPTLKFWGKMDLKNLISKLGASKVFTEPTSGVIENTPAVIGEAVQGAFMDAVEEGVTATAVSAPAKLDAADASSSQSESGGAERQSEEALPTEVAVHATATPSAGSTDEVAAHLVPSGSVITTSDRGETPEPLPFHATHPFAYAILRRDTVFFFGTYSI